MSYIYSGKNVLISRYMYEMKYITWHKQVVTDAITLANIYMVLVKGFCNKTISWVREQKIVNVSNTLKFWTQ